MSKETNTKQILLPVDFPANHSVSQEKEKEQMTIDTSGMKLLESVENANPDGSLAKMLKALLTSTTAWYSDRCKLTWKKKVSKSNVLLFQLQASVLGTKEKEFGSSLTMYPTPTLDSVSDREKKYKQGGLPLTLAVKMYPTPTATERSGINPKTGKGGGLNHLITVKMYPTPRVADIEGGAAKNVKMENGHFYRENKKGERWGVKLRDVMEMYPTPRASAAMTEDMETIAKRNKYNSKLEEKIAMDMYPTPTARDWKDTGINSNYKRMAEKSILSGTVMMKQKKVGGKLNPEFVEFLMGYPLNWTKVETTE